MSITKAAQANHDELFPNHQSTLKVTDPEFVELFDNFALDEVIAYGNLSTQTRLKVILASLIAMQTVSEYRVMLGGALNAGVTPVEVKEIVYQAVPYVGIARAFDFLHATNEILESRGVTLPLEGQSTTAPETRHHDGVAVQKSIFGDVIDTMYASSPENQRHIQQYLSANCFGDYYTRTGLDIPTRELLTFAMLLSMGGCEPQLRGHIQGNVNAGNDKATLLSVVTQLLPYVGYPRALNAISWLNEVIPEPSQPGR
jgi:4-carboxymuconolactone decarboxylase